MAELIEFSVDDMIEIDSLPTTEKQINRALSIAVNYGTRRGLARAKRRMQSQVALPKSYLDARFAVSRFARPDDPTARLTGTDRATSLARFAKPSSGRTQGVTVVVKPGFARYMRSGFLINLKNGNKGLAVRLGRGNRPRNTRGAKELGAGSGVWLLYGPSVDQIFTSVRDQISPELLDDVAREFDRQLRLS